MMEVGMSQKKYSKHYRDGVNLHKKVGGDTKHVPIFQYFHKKDESTPISKGCDL